MWLIFIWTLALSAALAMYFRQLYSRFSDYDVNHLPPTVLFGNLTKTIFRMEHTTDALQKVFNAFPEDRFVGFFELTNPLLVIRDPDLLKRITVKEFDSFTDHRSFVRTDCDPLFARSLFAMKGEEWRDMRSTLSPAFTSSKIKRMVPFMVEVGDQMIVTLKKKIQESKVGYIDEDANSIVSRYASGVIGSCAFGLKIDSWLDENNEFYQRGKMVSNFDFVQMIKLFITISYPMLKSILKLALFDKKSKEYFINLVLGLMKEREEKRLIRPDMIHLLMEAKKGKLNHEENIVSEHAGFSTVEESDIGLKKHNREWSDIDLIAQATLFILAGFDTVSTAMTFLLMELALNPDIQNKLVKEIRDNDKKNNGKIDYKSIQDMAYLDMVVSEVLRLWSPLFTTDRVCRQNINLGRAHDKATKDYIVRAGELIWIPLYVLHRDPKYFPDPGKFKPERFSKENIHKIKPFTYMPFGLGPRNCIGSRFALCEVKVMACQLLRHLEVAPCPRLQLPLKLSLDSIHPKVRGGAWLRLTIRK